MEDWKSSSVSRRLAQHVWGLVVVAHASNSSTQEIEARESEIQGRLSLQNTLKNVCVYACTLRVK